MRSPLVVFLFAFVLQQLSIQIGSYICKSKGGLEDNHRKDLDVILTALLTLLGLIIGFSFSMAVTRYDLRKGYEETEANAIGTEYFRVGLLPAADVMNTRELLKKYLEQRILFYVSRDERQLKEVDAYTVRLQAELWSAVQSVATAQPTPITALAAGGMNDVFNAQGYTQAAWWNRIPTEAWILLLLFAACSSLLFGYTARYTAARARLYFILPLTVAIAFFLIADLDSPRSGMIRVTPHNLMTLSLSLK
jgi:hypothetical protein